MSKFRAGIVGCGNIFTMHSSSLTRIENAEIAAVCDAKEERAKAQAAELGCKYYTDYKDMLENGGLDTVHICAPHYLHAPIAIYAAGQKKHVLTEKPMSIHYNDALEMVQAAHDNGVTLGVIFQNRYNPGSVLIKETLDSGALGRIMGARMSVAWHRTDEYYSESDWRGSWLTEGGGVIINQAIHTVDLMNWFIDSPVSYVDAHISTRAHKGIEVEDMAEGLIKYANGVTASFFAVSYFSYDAPVEVELHCENGTAKIKGSKGTVVFNDGSTLSADKEPQPDNTDANGKVYWGTSHIKQIKNFYAALEKGVSPDITGETVLNTQRLICAIYDSGRNNKKIIID